MTGRDILVVCQHHAQMQDFRQRWLLDYAMRQAPYYAEPGEMADRLDPAHYPCPDRLHYYRGRAQEVSGRIINIIAQTGTWYQRRHIHDELAQLRHFCPEAEWINETLPLHVFAINESDFAEYCNSRFLSPNDGHEAVFVSPDSILSPEAFHQRFPTAHYDMTHHYSAYTRGRTVTRPTPGESIPIFSPDGPTVWVNVPTDTPRPSLDDMTDAMRYATTHAVLQGTSWGWSATMEWPEWLDDETKRFLDDQFHARTHMRRVCVEAMEEARVGHTWHYFAQHKSLSHLACYLMYTHKINILLAKHWAQSYLDLYRLCGGYP